MTTAPPYKPFPKTVLSKLSELGLGHDDIQLAVYATLPENLKWFDYKNLLDAHNRADAVWHEQILKLLVKTPVDKREYTLTLEILGKQLNIQATQMHVNLTKDILDKYRSFFIQGKDGVDMQSELDVFAAARYDVFKDEKLINDLIFACIHKVSVDDLDILYADCPPVSKAEYDILKYWRAFMLGNIPAKPPGPNPILFDLKAQGEIEDNKLSDTRNELVLLLNENGLNSTARLLDRYKILRKILYTYNETLWRYLNEWN